MSDITQRVIKTGGDPRTLPDHASLRDELSKLTHPARPDVNWRYVEKLCLSLFEQNGVDLQTAARYTLARTQLAGLNGLNEGLAMLDALISHQWSVLWPQPVNARREILSGLSQRLQQQIRSLPLSCNDLSELVRAEQLLAGLGTTLQRLERKPVSQLDTLRNLVHNTAVRLESSDATSDAGTAIQAGMLLPATVRNDAAVATWELADSPAENTSGRAVRWVYITQPQQRRNAKTQKAMPAPVKQWQSFVAGMCTMLIITTVAVGSWQYLHRPDPLQIQFAASLAPLPAPLASEKLDSVRLQAPLPQAVIIQTQQQLARLDKLPPDWAIAYSRQLIEQAGSLWPEQAKPLALHWHQQLNAAALPTGRLHGWYQGMMTLQKLSDRLNGLDEQKGKYMTVSELKSVVFSTMQSFRQSIPAEEQLRALSQNPPGEPLPVAATAQLEMHLKQLTARYAEIKLHASEYNGAEQDF